MNLDFFNELSTTDLLLIAAAALVVIYILSKIAKSLLKIAAVLALVVLIYMIWTGKSPDQLLEPGIKAVFQDKNVDELYAEHCAVDKRDKALCICVVEPVYRDLHERFSLRELRRFDRDQLAEETLVSYRSEQDGIQDCLKQKGVSKLNVLELLRENWRPSAERSDS